MKLCPKCSTPLEDNSAFCPTCGARFVSAAVPANGSNVNFNEADINDNRPYQPPQGAYMPPPPPEQMPVDPFDHTSEFSPKDVSENKVIAMLLYLMSVIGILVALLSQNKSDYVAFHLRQALKFLVVEALVSLATVVLSWTFVVPIAGAIALIALNVVKVICFLQICKGEAKEPYIIRNLSFLK